MNLEPTSYPAFEILSAGLLLSVHYILQYHWPESPSLRDEKRKLFSTQCAIKSEIFLHGKFKLIDENLDTVLDAFTYVGRLDTLISAMVRPEGTPRLMMRLI